MIRIQPTHTTDVEHYTFIEELLIKSFPPQEYRKLAQLRQYTDSKSNFANNTILEGDRLVGLISYWHLEHFYYIEHFAINPALRNKGYGQKVLHALCKELNRPIVLEVELPSDETAQRRIHFYQKNGFTLWKQEYAQPPYRTGDEYLPMHLMAYGNLSCERDFEEVKKRIYKEVYNL
jgi:ribosomal protein S18 acetylase RimI-like enzyme